MGLNVRYLEITRSNSSELSSFIENLGDEQNSFRYYNNRGSEVLENHRFTCLLYYDDCPIGYGHLDEENETIWLGIIVIKKYQGKGFAKELMKYLLHKAQELKIKKIHLSVDKDNIRAKNLYEKFGFEVVSNKIDYTIMSRELFKNEKTFSIGISSLAFLSMSKEKIVEMAKENDWTIEFSSSFPYQEDMINFFIRTNINRLAHNYFPAPKEPFVVNLASRDPKIRKLSIDHCIQGLQLAKRCNAPCFSAHAGFCIDPDPNQLGSRLDVNVPIDRNLNWKLFIDSIEQILLEAERLDLAFYIENNVTAKFNLRTDGQEVLFCSRAEEMVKMINEVDSERFGLLLDTAHLKVSSHALNFNLKNAIEKIRNFVKYIHHSDNNGENDSNESINDEYWFLPWTEVFKNCIHILEVKNITENQIKEQIGLLSNYMYGKNSNL